MAEASCVTQSFVIRGPSREGEEGEGGGGRGRGSVVEAIEREFGVVVRVRCGCFGREIWQKGEMPSRYPLARSKQC
jgi:hypothetical protein